MVFEQFVVDGVTLLFEERKGKDVKNSPVVLGGAMVGPFGNRAGDCIFLFLGIVRPDNIGQEQQGFAQAAKLAGKLVGGIR